MLAAMLDSGGGAARAKAELGRTAQAGALQPVCRLSPVSLTGMDDIQGCSHRFPRLRGDTGLGVVLRCLQRRGWARASAWQGRGWVSNCERWAWGDLPLSPLPVRLRPGSAAGGQCREEVTVAHKDGYPLFAGWWWWWWGITDSCRVRGSFWRP